MSPGSEPVELILRYYPVKALEIKSELYNGKRTTWWVKTQNGMRILRKMPCTEDSVRFILDAATHLSRGGVQLPGVNKTKDGRDYINVENSFYMLTDAVVGKNPSFSDSREIKLAVEALAGFHKASAGFLPLSGGRPGYHLGTWVEDYADKLEGMYRFFRSGLFDDGVSKAILREFPYLYERAQKAITGLNGPEYGAWAEKIKETGCLCHQDFSEGALMITGDEEVYFLHLDCITIDIPARDIRKLLNKIMRKAGCWDIGLTGMVLQGYQAVNPLTADEWQVVKLNLMFPHVFLGALGKYYCRCDKERKEKHFQRLTETAAFEKSLQPVLDSFDSIIPL